MFKRSNLLKLQSEQEKARKKNEDRVNKKVNEEIFPLLKEISEDIIESTMIPSVLSQTIQQAVLNLQTTLTVKELGLTELLREDNPQTEKYRKLLNMLESETVKDAFAILEGINNEIGRKQRLFWKGKQLSELYDKE